MAGPILLQKMVGPRFLYSSEGIKGRLGVSAKDGSLQLAERNSSEAFPPGRDCAGLSDEKYDNFFLADSESYIRKKDFAFNLETAVRDDKVMQDFELESFTGRGRHSLVGVHGSFVGRGSCRKPHIYVI